jgi:hypothetical protein
MTHLGILPTISILFLLHYSLIKICMYGSIAPTGCCL